MLFYLQHCLVLMHIAQQTPMQVEAIRLHLHFTHLSSVLYACVCHIRIIPKKEECGWLILIGTLGGVTTLLLFTAFTYIASGIATILHFTYPVYVAIGSVWLLNKKMTKGKTIALVLSVLGVVFLD